MVKEHGHALPAGYEFDGYRIQSMLGTGGFGITYRAIETELKRPVAIKEYLPAGVAMRAPDSATVRPISDTDNDDFEYGLDRFRAEAETLVRFDHPNIVRVYRYLSANGTAYLVMQYVEGENLGDLLGRFGTLTEEQIHGFLDPILDGLDQVHAAGFLHRDIKPENIYIRTDGSPTLLDFGSARLALGERSRSLTAIVSRGYAPFEQYSSKARQGPWTDVYALGATLYRCVTGLVPPDSMDRVEEDDLQPVHAAAVGSYSPGLLDAIDAALLMQASNRPRNVQAFRELLYPYASRQSSDPSTEPAPPPSPPISAAPSQSAASNDGPPVRPVSEPTTDEIPKAPPRKRRRAFAGMVSLIAALAAGSAVYWYIVFEDSGYGQCVRRMTEDAKLIKLCTDAITSDRLWPTSLAHAHFKRATGYAARKQLTRALADLTEAIRLEPNTGLYYFTRARVYRRVGWYDEAIEDLRTAISLEPQNQHYVEALRQLTLYR